MSGYESGLYTAANEIVPHCPTVRTDDVEIQGPPGYLQVCNLSSIISQSKIQQCNGRK